jgi:hypothetical protein
MIMSIEESVERELVSETEVLGRNLPHCHTSIVLEKTHKISSEPPNWTLLNFLLVWDDHDRLCGLVVRVPGCRTEMYCVSCEVRTEFMYFM